LVAALAVAAGCGGGSDKPGIDKVIPVGQDPTDLVAAFGSIWVVNGDAVARVDPKTNALQLKMFVPTAEGADGIAAGGGRIWVPCAISASVVGINPTINKVDRNIKVLSRPTAATYGFGSVWVSQGGNDRIQRVDPVKKKAITPPIDVSFGPAGLEAGYGAVWVPNQFKYTVSRVDPNTDKVVATIPVGVQPTDVAVGEGAVWVANSNSDSVTRIDPRTNKVVATIPLKGNNPSDVTTGLGAVWVAQIDSKSIARIDPKTNKETTEIPLQGDSPLDIATGFGSVWVPIAEGSFIERVKP